MTVITQVSQTPSARIAEMAEILGGHAGPPPHTDRNVGADPRVGPLPFDLVEAGAGNGRLSADILRTARRDAASFYDSIRLRLVEASATARGAQRETLGDRIDHVQHIVEPSGQGVNVGPIKGRDPLAAQAFDRRVSQLVALVLGERDLLGQLRAVAELLEELPE